MKITIILLTAVCLHVSARSWSQKVTLSVKNMPLQKVFTLIEKQTGYAFFYDLDLLSGHTASLDVKDAEITAVLKECLRDLPLDFKVVNTTIAIIKRQRPKIVAELAPAPRAETEVKGQVKTEAGLPMSGATVTLISGKTRKSIATNAEGEFVVSDLPKGKYTMEITFIGYETFRREVIIGDQAVEVSAILKAAISGLDETVVKGYYNTTKRLNTGNVTSVKGEDIQKQPVSDPIMALEGRVPGLYITQTSGLPGTNLTVRLRGQNSIVNGNDPLYIVDGVPFTSTSITSPDIGGGAVGFPAPTPGLGYGSGQGMSPFNSLNPADIESIEVLKDADATAIYGSRGANGVILIITKRGKAGVTKFDANVYSGVGSVTREMKLLNTQQYLQMRHQAFANDGAKPGVRDYDINGAWDTTRYTNWQKVLIGNTAQFTNAQISLSGGTANTQFLIGGGYSRQTTVFPGDYSDRKASVHFNLSHSSINQKFHVTFSTQYVDDNNILPQTDFTANIRLAPDAPPIYDANGNINWQKNSWFNPLASTLKSAKAITNNLVGSLNLSYEIFPGLQFKSNLGYTHIQMNQNILSPASALAPPNNTNPSRRTNSFATNNINTWILEPQLNYAKALGNGRLDVLIGVTQQQNIASSLGQRASNFTSDALISNVASASSIQIVGNNHVEYHYEAIYGRIGYNWQDKYIINLTARRDGSSRFGPGNQFGNFGAIGAGWIFSNEKFIQNNNSFLNFGKLRISYGTTGNDQIADYQYLSAYSSYSSSTYQGVNTLYPTNLSNPNFGWELVKKLEGGIDLGFFRDRISLNVSYYRNRTGNQLVGYTLPSITGFTTVQANLPAIVQNSGIEFALTTNNIKTSHFTWSSSFNLTIPRNRLVSFPNLSNSTYSNTYSIGKSLFIQKAYHYVGINDTTGVYQFESKFDPKNPIYPDDLQSYKEIAQKYYGGFQNTFQYRGFQLDIFFQFVKQTGYNYLYNFNQPGTFNQNQPTLVLAAWQKQGDKKSIEQYSQSFGSDAANAFSYFSISDASISDASFVRLKNISFSYTLPERWQNRFHCHNAKVYLLGQNLITFTKYVGLDPETGGVSLPPLRIITGGIQVTF